jgi:hypothetical protein
MTIYRGAICEYHINFGPKKGYMAVLERMLEISRNCIFMLKNEIRN